jgi:hypothetical protein
VEPEAGVKVIVNRSGFRKKLSMEQTGINGCIVSSREKKAKREQGRGGSRGREGTAGVKHGRGEKGEETIYADPRETLSRTVVHKKC